ncbi:MAG: hypothetical protein K2Q10_12885, partial [Rhodospirillales bacterium]|nr:hypothetical protein [Rhodospirillales bacterium]
FFGGPFLEANRQVLETHLYKIAKRRKLADAEARHAFLQEHRPLIWKILGEKLGKLAGLHKNAQAQLAKQAATADQPPQFKIVQIPVTVPKVYKVLGVTFHLGTEVKMRKTKVQVTQGLEPAESEAHLLYTRFNELCRAEGVTLPDGADFQFLKCLLEFDANKFSKFHKEYKALADHPETTPRYLNERLKYLDTALNNYLSDVLSLMLFYDGCFHFDLKMLYETCIGASLNKSAQATKRPFIQSEVRRRPLELAWQVREAMRQTLDAETIAAATRFLFMMHDMMNKARFKAELEQSISILEALPVDCADDPHAKAFAEAIVPLARHLRGQDKDAQTAINRMIEVCRTALGCEAGAAAVPA